MTKVEYETLAKVLRAIEIHNISHEDDTIQIYISDVPGFIYVDTNLDSIEIGMRDGSFWGSSDTIYRDYCEKIYYEFLRDINHDIVGIVITDLFNRLKCRHKKIQFFKKGHRYALPNFGDNWRTPKKEVWVPESDDSYEVHDLRIKAYESVKEGNVLKYIAIGNKINDIKGIKREKPKPAPKPVKKKTEWIVLTWPSLNKSNK